MFLFIFTFEISEGYFQFKGFKKMWKGTLDRMVAYQNELQMMCFFTL